MSENDCIERQARLTKEQAREECALWTRLAFRLMDLIPLANMERARQHFSEMDDFYNKRDAEPRGVTG